MNIKTYARIAQGMVAELFATNGDIGSLFHGNLLWVDVTDIRGVAYGWNFDGRRFAQQDLSAAEAEAQTQPTPAAQQSVLPASWGAEHSAE